MNIEIGKFYVDGNGSIHKIIEEFQGYKWTSNMSGFNPDGQYLDDRLSNRDLIMEINVADYFVFLSQQMEKHIAKGVSSGC